MSYELDDEGIGSVRLALLLDVTYQKPFRKKDPGAACDRLR